MRARTYYHVNTDQPMLTFTFFYVLNIVYLCFRIFGYSGYIIISTNFFFFNVMRIDLVI